MRVEIRKDAALVRLWPLRQEDRSNCAVAWLPGLTMTVALCSVLWPVLTGLTGPWTGLTGPQTGQVCLFRWLCPVCPVCGPDTIPVCVLHCLFTRVKLSVSGQGGGPLRWSCHHLHQSVRADRWRSPLGHGSRGQLQR